MSNNAPDYENLAFPPRHDETAYELQLKVNKLEKENAQLRKFLEEFNALDVAKENQQLKELLRECKPYVIRNVVFTTVNRAEVVDLEKNELLAKIDNVIGEKK